MKIRGVIVDSAAIQRRVYKFTPFIEAIFSSPSRYSFQSFALDSSTQDFTAIGTRADEEVSPLGLI